MSTARQMAWLDPAPLETLDRSGSQSVAPEDASLRSGAPAALVSQASLWIGEPTRIVGHSFERLHREDGVAVSICHTHRTEVIGWGRSPCRSIR